MQMEDAKEPRERRTFPPAEKVAILRERLIEGIEVSAVCEKHQITPALFYRWQQEFFDNGAAAFEQRKDTASRKLEGKLMRLA
jgi:transposase